MFAWATDSGLIHQYTVNHVKRKIIVMHLVQFRIRVFLAALFAVMVLGTLGFMVIERFSLADAFYFSIVTIATVGYGDIHPATQAGKILAIILIITGVGSFLGLVANASEMMLNRREKQAREAKLHMVIGIFFSEVGTNLLADFYKFGLQTDGLKENLLITKNWSERDFQKAGKRCNDYLYEVEIQKVRFEILRDFLVSKRDILVRLLENPILLEHEFFTDLLRAVFHLAEELACREDLTQLPDSDKEHLAGDIQRAYKFLVPQWLNYMKYLKDYYPYLFSLALRTNPFDKDASPIVNQ